LTSPTFVLETDGSSKGNPGRAGAGYILSVDGRVVVQGKRHLGITTNNVAEYAAMIMGLEKARELGVTKIVVITDSLLLAKQMGGSYKVRQPHLRSLHKRCVDLASKFDSFEIRYMPSEQNRAHLLAEQAAGT